MSDAFIITRFSVLQEQYDYIEALLEPFGEHTARFFKHILASTIIQAKKRNGSIPISCRLRDSAFPGARWKLLDQSGLILPTDYDSKHGLSTEYVVNPTILREFQNINPLRQLSDEACDKYTAMPKVNLFTGKPINVNLPSRTTDKKGHPVPDLVKEAIQAFKVCYFNRTNILEYLRGKKAAYESLVPNTEEYQEAYFSYLNDLHCLENLLDRAHEPTDKAGVYSYAPCYVPLATGRIAWAAQSASREMKQVMYDGINPELKNYDLRASQAVILLQHMTEAGIDCPWLVDYINNPNAKEEYARQIGITKETWKDCLYSLFMGGRLPYRTTVSRKMSSIESYIVEEVKDSSKLEGIYELFKAIVAPLKAAIDQWHRYLVEVYANNPKNHRGSGNRIFVYNQCDKPFYFNNPKKSSNDTKRELAAHILQGHEACFIHNLTLLGQEFGFQPIGNEHDGLIVIGEIPEEAIVIARDIADLPGAILEEKAFHDKTACKQ